MPKGGAFLLPSNVVPDTFTLEDATEDQQMVRGTVGEFVREVIIPQAAKLENHASNAETSRALLRKSAELGLLGLEVPEEPYGGAGLDPLTAALALEPLGEYGSWACTVAAHAGIGTFPLRLYGTEEQKARYLAKLVSGEMPAAYALTEDKVGSSPAEMEMTATPVPGGWTLKGKKQFITNAGFAGLFTKYAKLPDDGADQFTAFLVERASPGIVIGNEEHKIGIWGSSTASVTCESVFVPDSNLLGAPHGGKKIALNTLNLGRFKLGVVCLGAARACLKMATEYSRQRPQGGRLVIEYGMVRQRLAGIAVRVAAMEAIVYRTALLLRDALAHIPESNPTAMAKAIEQYAMECSIVKVFCSEALSWITSQNVKAHGGNGFTLDYGAARYFQDAIINEIFEGTNDINRLVIMEMFFRRGIMKSMLAPSFWTAFGGLNGIKRRVIVDAALTLRRFGAVGFTNRQVLIGAAADNIIDLYVLDSVVAAQHRHPTAARAQALLLLQLELLPAIRSRLSRSAKRERTINDIVGQLPT